jgi:hypothetical protein
VRRWSSLQVYGQEHWMSLQRSGSALQTISAADVARLVGNHGALLVTRAKVGACPSRGHDDADSKISMPSLPQSA